MSTPKMTAACAAGLHARSGEEACTGEWRSAIIRAGVPAETGPCSCACHRASGICHGPCGGAFLFDGDRYCRECEEELNSLAEAAEAEATFDLPKE